MREEEHYGDLIHAELSNKPSLTLYTHAEWKWTG